MTNSFFGDIVAPVDGFYDMEENVVIPAGTILQAMIEEAKWDTYQPPEGEMQTFIKITWTILDQGEYNGMKLFQKLQCMDEKKKPRALQMLAAIDANSKGEIMAAGVMPQDMQLSIGLVNARMNVKLATWGKKDPSTGVEVPAGNWISSVSRIVQTQQQAINTAVNNVAPGNVIQPEPTPVPQQQLAPQQQAPAQQFQDVQVDQNAPAQQQQANAANLAF